MMHSPPATRSRSDILEARLLADMRNYRKILQKVARYKTKIMFALAGRRLPGSLGNAGRARPGRGLGKMWEVSGMCDTDNCGPVPEDAKTVKPTGIAPSILGCASPGSSRQALM